MNELAAKMLTDARKKRGLSQTELAKSLAKSLKQTYSLRQYQKLEEGSFPKYKKEVVAHLDKILGTNISELIYEHQVPRENQVDSKAIGRRNVDLEEELGIIEENLIGIAAHLEVFESAIAGLMSKEKGDFIQRVSELREAVAKSLNRRTDELKKKERSSAS